MCIHFWELVTFQFFALSLSKSHIIGPKSVSNYTKNLKEIQQNCKHTDSYPFSNAAGNTINKTTIYLIVLFFVMT